MTTFRFEGYYLIKKFEIMKKHSYLCLDAVENELEYFI